MAEYPTVTIDPEIKAYIDSLFKQLEWNWHNPKEIPLPLNKQVLVYLTDNTFSVARRLPTCTVVGHSVPVEDTILLWIEIPALPGGFTK